jgi:hypothetical protein
MSMTTDRREVEELAARLLVADWGAREEFWDESTRPSYIAQAFTVAEAFMAERDKRRKA